MCLYVNLAECFLGMCFWKLTYKTDACFDSTYAELLNCVWQTGVGCLYTQTGPTYTLSVCTFINAPFHLQKKILAMHSDVCLYSQYSGVRPGGSHGRGVSPSYIAWLLSQNKWTSKHRMSDRCLWYNCDVPCAAHLTWHIIHVRCQWILSLTVSFPFTVTLSDFYIFLHAFLNILSFVIQIWTCLF